MKKDNIVEQSWERFFKFMGEKKNLDNITKLAMSFYIRGYQDALGDGEETSKKTLNMNDFAVKVSRMEKGKKEIGIGNIKEIIKCSLILLARMKPADALSVIKRYKKYNIKKSKKGWDIKKR